MNNLTTSNDNGKLDLSSRLKLMNDEELFQFLKEGFDVTVNGIINMAAGVGEAERRGWELHKIPVNGLLHHLRRIAQDQLMPEVVSRYIGNNQLLNLVAKLTRSEQKKVIDSSEFDTVVIGENGQFTVRQFTLEQMATEQRRLVFAPDHVRTATEQIAVLEGKRLKAPEGPDTVGFFSMDYATQSAKFTGSKNEWISLSELESVVRALRRYKKKQRKSA